MKKRIFTIVLIASLALGLSFSAFGMPVLASSAPTSSQTASAPSRFFTPAQWAEIIRLNGEILKNQASLFTLKAQNVNLAGELKILLKDFKASGKTLSPEDLAALKALKTELASTREQLKTSVGEIHTLMASYKQLRKNRDYAAVIAVLNQILTVQQNRIAVCTQINAVTQQMIDLLKG